MSNAITGDHSTAQVDAVKYWGPQFGAWRFQPRRYGRSRLFIWPHSKLRMCPCFKRDVGYAGEKEVGSHISTTEAAEHHFYSIKEGAALIRLVCSDLQDSEMHAHLFKNLADLVL